MRYVIAALALAISCGAFAQAQAPRGYDCSQAKDPKACEERRDKLKAAHEQAQKACEGKRGAERSDCMRKQMCTVASSISKRSAMGGYGIPNPCASSA